MPKVSSKTGMPVNVRLQLSWLDSVPYYLGRENMRRMRCSCFGHLFELHPISNQGQLYNALFRKLDSSSASRMRLAFNIDGQNVEFGPEEFCAISGLKFKGELNLPEKSQFHEEVFNGNPYITMMVLLERFTEECCKSPESELSFKLALLYVVYSVFFIKERTKKALDLRYMHLVEDVDAFLDYPWGAAAYHFLVLESHDAKKTLSHKMCARASLSLEVCGFITVLQCWAYDILPKVASEFAVKVNPDAIPRILRWSVTSEKKKYQYYNSVFKQSEIELVPFEISDNEEVKLTELGVWEYVSSLPPPSTVVHSIGKRKINDDWTESSLRSMEVRRCSLLNRDGSPATSNVVTTSGDVHDRPCEKDVAAAIRELSKTTKDLAAAVTVLSVRCDHLEAANTNPHLVEALSRLEGHIAKLSYFHTGVSSVSNIQTQSSPTVDTVSNVENTPLSTEAKWPTEVGQRTITPFEHAQTKRRRSASGNPAALPKGIVPRVTRSSTMALAMKPSSTRYDPFESDYESKEKGGDFWMWYSQAKAKKSKATIRLPGRLLRHVRYNWFDQMLSQRKWLGSDHLDALLNLLIYKQREDRNQFLNGWTCLEHYGWVKLSASNFEEVADNVMMPYVLGNKPYEGGLPWHEARSIYAIANVNGNHWVAVEISLQQQKLVVYNSISSSINWKHIPKCFTNAAKNLPWLCKHKGVWEKMNTSLPLKLEWDVVQHRNTPQQRNGSDCGVMAMKYVECMATGHDVGEIDAERCAIFRKRYCAQLYAYATKFAHQSDCVNEGK